MFGWWENLVFGQLLEREMVERWLWTVGLTSEMVELSRRRKKGREKEKERMKKKKKKKWRWWWSGYEEERKKEVEKKKAKRKRKRLKSGMILLLNSDKFGKWLSQI